MAHGPVSLDSRELLAGQNFHYILGYSRNLRSMLGPVGRSGSLELIQEIISHDHKLSNLLFSGIKKLEWRLRAIYVDAYCASYIPSSGNYLKEATYREGRGHRTVTDIACDILRSKEPFITDGLKRKADDKGIEVPRSLNDDNRSLCLSLMDSLPVWAVVDSFSFGTLVSALMEMVSPNGDQAPWKKTARKFDVAERHFNSNLSSVRATRNLVAHHARLWSRPSVFAPQISPYIEKYAAGADPKSRIIAVLALSELLDSLCQDRDFRIECLDVALSFPEYWQGMRSI